LFGIKGRAEVAATYRDNKGASGNGGGDGGREGEGVGEGEGGLEKSDILG